MTMADTIAVMNRGQVEQLGEPAELYDRPRTEFVAGFLGVSNLLRGSVIAPDRVRIEAGDELSGHCVLGRRGVLRAPLPRQRRRAVPRCRQLACELVEKLHLHIEGGLELVHQALVTLDRGDDRARRR